MTKYPKVTLTVDDAEAEFAQGVVLDDGEGNAALVLMPGESVELTERLAVGNVRAHFANTVRTKRPPVTGS